MPVDRRQFLANSAKAAAAAKLLGEFMGFAQTNPSAGADTQKPYGSGYFGEWIEDEFGLPAFHYTCDQTRDSKAVTEVNSGILSRTEHVHQVEGGIGPGPIVFMRGGVHARPGDAVA